MTRPEIVFLLEEESAKVLIEGILPRIFGRTQQVPVRYIVFDGKQDLERQLERKIRGYLNPEARFIVLRDQDAEDCRFVKERLLQKCRPGGNAACKVRIACRELESFYLGDLAAVEAGLGIPGFSRRLNQAPYRNPDSIQKPSEFLIKSTKKRFQKVGGARAIAPHLNLDDNRSASFGQLVQLIRSTITTLS